MASTTWLGHTLGVLRRPDCDTTQGFLHSPPLPAAQFRDWCSVHLAGLETAP